MATLPGIWPNRAPRSMTPWPTASVRSAHTPPSRPPPPLRADDRPATCGYGAAATPPTTRPHSSPPPWLTTGQSPQELTRYGPHGTEGTPEREGHHRRHPADCGGHHPGRRHCPHLPACRHHHSRHRVHSVRRVDGKSGRLMLADLTPRRRKVEERDGGLSFPDY